MSSFKFFYQYKIKKWQHTKMWKSNRAKWTEMLQNCKDKKMTSRICTNNQLLQLTREDIAFNHIQDGPFQGSSHMGVGGWGGGKKVSLPKIYHTYPTMMKLGTLIPYLKKIQKIYKSRDTALEFWWHQHFFTGNQQILLYQEIQI